MTVPFSDDRIAERAEETMPKESEYTEVERFKRKGRKIVVRTIEDRTEIVVDGEPHEVKFLDNGRPWTDAYVNVMASSVRDLAERWVDFQAAQEKHWADVHERRRAVDKNKKDQDDGAPDEGRRNKGGER